MIHRPLLKLLLLAAIAQPTPQINVTTRIVLLDVVVTDSSGNPVTNLQQSDFAIYEDKLPQRIASFEAPAAHSAASTILVLDELNTRFADSSFATDSLRRFLQSRPAQLPQPTSLMLVSDNQFHLLQNFTRDRDSLLAALQQQRVHNSWRLETDHSTGYGTVERLDQSLSALEQIAQSTASTPGHKDLLWIGQGFPSLDPTTLAPSDLELVENTIRHVTNLLLDTRITLYAVSPTTSAATTTEITDPTQLEFAQLAGGSLANNADPFASTLDFDRLAPATGGRVIRNLNNIETQIAHSIDLGSAYYTLSYTPSNTSAATQPYRNIHVVCLRPGLTVSTRNGYYTTPPPSETSTKTLLYDLNTAALSAVPLTALHITATPAPTAPNTYTIHTETSNLTWQTTSTGTREAKVSVLAVALSQKNKILSHTLQTMTATAKPTAQLQLPGTTVALAITTTPAKGATRLRFVVRDAATGRMGTTDLPLRP